MTECDGCGLERDPVQTVDVYDGTEHYCIACAETPDDSGGVSDDE